MFNAFVRVVFVVALVFFLGACDSLSEEKIAIGYAPSAGPIAVPGAENVRVSVVATDKRAQLKDRIATKRAITTARVVADNDVVELVRSAVERELKGQGFVIGAGGVAITIEVQNFYSDFPPESWALAAAANVAFTLRARDGAGRTLYTRFYDGTGKVSDVVNQSAENAKTALERALAAAVRQVVEDPALRAALLSSRSPQPGTGRA